MKKSILILPTSKHTGLRILASSVVYALQQKGLKVDSFHPIYDMDMSIEQIESYLLNNRVKDYVEIVLSRFYEKCLDSDFAVISGLFRQGNNYHRLYPLNAIVDELNIEIIKALGSEVIIVSYHGNKPINDINDELDYAMRSLPKQINIMGAVITKLNAPYDDDGRVSFSLTEEDITYDKQQHVGIAELKELSVFKHKGLVLLGVVEWDKERTSPRILDIKNILKLNHISEVGLEARVDRVMMCSRGVDNFISDLTPNSLIITAADRSDILVTTCLAAKNGMKIAGIILTAEEYLDNKVRELCVETAKKAGLAILTTKNKSVNTILKLASIDLMGIPIDDKERIQKVKEVISSSLDRDTIVRSITSDISEHQVMSPPAFRYHLLKMARKAKKRIILPESYEPRTLQAAKNCHEQGLAECVLIGDREKIFKVAEMNGFSLPESIEVVTVVDEAEAKYLKTLMELRKHKGLSESMARDALKDPIVVATLMLYLGEVDGLVSGAEHTTADVLRPALQLVKTKPNSSLVSSVFFMCMPDEVIVFGDCAVNQDPTAEQLVDIAIQSAESAKKFGIEPRVAMISYSTGSSGSGVQVEKVRKATELLKQSAPDLLVDGPLQYDAAMIESVAKKKAPNSPVAGKATVLIFPDLNTGNTVYKAVQRSANVLSIGPVLQGINKPVNDLSRGATVDDITYTIAITAIQAI
ncbi:phosphate acetyltransferase [Francisella philomiragia]|uniref:phosphate acetyltransferase n=1 Tax=Francisella philomiragia TaxID=28110 RepID=UPI001907FAF0|nr:phosphate acetyltransferase [Francisella philomiragia]MBK2257046.1 phosphate acetyltransferase [Francisella philomiragia]MBK2269703.1 phosphate acetyltransferase [Francisella philomiragia]MBK2271586.1 phosphate acetyltransferase [Francisella philomiragia]MBK2275367.1 phosphate acetyltransferase [Francisella philomiragia]MBK2294961.1 phosphate acetyltransferase [Francisella philomiragia]